MHPLLHLLVLLNVGFSLSNPVTTAVPTVPPNACENKPCLNNGTCFFTARSLQEDLAYTCTCSPGFTGMNCEFFIDPCTSKPCLHGNCSSRGSNEGYICVCEEGYQGGHCDQPLQSIPVSRWTESLLPGLLSPTSAESPEPDTLSPPVQVAATLSPWQPKPGQKYVELSWAGKQLPLDFACGNGSSNGSAGGRSSSLEVPEETSVKIKVNVTGYPTLWKVTEAGFNQCSLTEGGNVPLLQGLDGLILSEEELPVGNNYFIVFVNDSSKPVWTLRLNVSVKTTFYCECSRGFTGIFCEEFDACTENPCENNGTCTDVRQGDDGKNVICACQAGYRGSVCEEKIDPCASSPCQNNGSCYSNGLAYSCSCSPWYTGPTCTQLIDFCALNPCAHGICRSVGTSYKCLCIPAFLVRKCNPGCSEYYFNIGD
ncbi:UNVERIFIED_CONTAM: hypothetical protein FKN15_044762 [Acipenser sinensis]